MADKDDAPKRKAGKGGIVEPGFKNDDEFNDYQRQQASGSKKKGASGAASGDDNGGDNE